MHDHAPLAVALLCAVMGALIFAAWALDEWRRRR